MSDQAIPFMFERLKASTVEPMPAPTAAAAKAALTGDIAAWLAEKARAKSRAQRGH